MKTRNIIAVVAILGLAGATPWISNGMTALSREVSESSAIQLIEKGCTDLGVVEVKTSTVQIDPIGPGPFKTEDKPKRVRRFVCGDGSQHDRHAD